MESLESKLDRLSPEQRKETEDFVDFLLSRSGQVYLPPDVSLGPPPVLQVAPPPLILIGPTHVADTQTAGPQEIGLRDDRIPPAAGEEVPAPFHEIGGGIPDRIALDFMDYGQFERQPSSPATDAVMKVKRKIIAKEDQNKPHQLLDWVD
jgi:hypothetical protein